MLDEPIEDPGSTSRRNADDRADPADRYIDLPQVTIPPEGGMDDVKDLDYQGKKCVVEQAPMVPGDDGDDNPETAQVRPKADNDKLDRGDISDPVRPKPDTVDNPAGQMIEAGHGFMVEDRRSRPWKTGNRTHCAFCGGPMPTPDVSRYQCEFDPDASAAELALIGSGQGPDDRPRPLWDFWPGNQYKDRLQFPGCQCSGCNLRWQVANGMERNRGQPKKYCTALCRKQADAERNAWKRAVVAAEKRGDQPPPEPEDRGLKFVLRNGLRSSAEGHGHRYTAANGSSCDFPRA
ncbi:hypothetical protein [Mycolicibacterium peregrinum]|uniref:Uncharacterized protein n=1 Tax=Mycolicibacterium peregrinum TaxID=43304 RepID=A0A4Z0HUD6_MYCPR|nr:hypothetical protein [Mycolicibacterium peregrinum]TGB41448.1 hypothetical protein EJD98_16145 [Mycolicibacterium peregrinum]TGB41828.1 hypothetical protein EJD94_15685 [Mycolicibacterium peregrinum]